MTTQTEQRATGPNYLRRLVRHFRLWLNAITADEGCTMVDARKLREYNHALAEENHRLREDRDCEKRRRKNAEDYASELEEVCDSDQLTRAKGAYKANTNGQTGR